MFYIVYAFKGQVHVFAGQVKIVSHSSSSISAILKYFCPLHWFTCVPEYVLDAQAYVNFAIKCAIASSSALYLQQQPLYNFFT